jgi:plasmid maintenance system antidote protein VapI
MRLKRYLQKQGESQAVFAEKARVPRTTVADVCRGYSVTLDNALRIVEATGGLVSFGDLKSHAKRPSRALGERK